MRGLTSFRPFSRSSGLLQSANRSFSSSASHSLARLTLIGHLGAEPELVTTSTGREVVRYVVATSRGPRDDRQTSWFRITSFSEGPSRDHLLNLPKGYVNIICFSFAVISFHSYMQYILFHQRKMTRRC